MMRIALSFCSFLLVIAQSVVDAQTNWPGFRNNGSGVTRVNHAPKTWSPESGVAWRSTIPGYGQSAPVIWKNLIFLTSSDGPFQEHCYVHAFDLQTGKKKWTTEVKATTKVENYFRNSRAAPTCVVDENLVVSFFASGDVTAMTHSGKTAWTVPLFKKYGNVENERGVASSLTQDNDRVFVLVDHNGPSYLVAINKSNGQIAWKTKRGKRVPSWSSPVATKFQGNQLIVVSSADSLDAYDAKTGKKLWTIDGVQGNHIPSASVVGNSIYVGSTKMYGSSADPKKVARSNSRVDLVMKDNKLTHQVKWGAERANSYYSTPLAFAGYVYYVNKSGVLFCIDQQTGKRMFAKRIGNPCWASAIGVETKSGEKFVYFFLKNGFAVVLRPGKTFDQIARNQLWDYHQMKAAEAAAAKLRKKNVVPADQAKPKTGPEKVLSGMSEKSLHKMFSYGDPIVYAIALVDGNLLVRTGQHLFCIRPQKSNSK